MSVRAYVCGASSYKWQSAPEGQAGTMTLVDLREALTLVRRVIPPDQSHCSLSHPG